MPLSAQRDQHLDAARARSQRLQPLDEAGSTVLAQAAPSACVGLDGKLAAVLMTTGRYDEALAVLQHAADLYRASDDREGEARVLALAGQAHYHQGTSGEGIPALRPFLDRIEQDDCPAVSPTCLALIDEALALLFFATGRYDEQLAMAEHAARLARTAADGRVLARAEVSRVLALLALGRRDEAQRVLEGAIPLAEVAGDPNSLARALNNLSNVHYFRGSSTGVYLQRGLELAEQMGDPTTIAHMLFMLGTNNVWMGNWPTSHAYFEKAMTAVRPLGQARVAALPLYGMGQLAILEGDWDTAVRRLHAAPPRGRERRLEQSRPAVTTPDCRHQTIQQREASRDPTMHTYMSANMCSW